MDNGLGLRFSQFSAKNGRHKRGTLNGLGNRRSIRLSYGANGSFPSFPPNTEAATTTQTRNGGLNMVTQEGAQQIHGLIALAERCERATGPDRELDEAIAKATGWLFVGAGGMRWVNGDREQRPEPNAFTASLDAAMTLVPEGWRPIIDLASEEGRCMVDLWALPSVTPEPARHHAIAATPALAICAAALRARANQKGPTP